MAGTSGASRRDGAEDVFGIPAVDAQITEQLTAASASRSLRTPRPAATVSFPAFDVAARRQHRSRAAGLDNHRSSFADTTSPPAARLSQRRFRLFARPPGRPAPPTCGRQPASMSHSTSAGDRSRTQLCWDQRRLLEPDCESNDCISVLLHSSKTHASHRHVCSHAAASSLRRANDIQPNDCMFPLIELLANRTPIHASTSPTSVKVNTASFAGCCTPFPSRRQGPARPASCRKPSVSAIYLLL